MNVSLLKAAADSVNIVDMTLNSIKSSLSAHVVNVNNTRRMKGALFMNAAIASVQQISTVSHYYICNIRLYDFSQVSSYIRI